MRLWYAGIGIVFGFLGLLYIRYGNMMFPAGVFAVLFTLACFLGSVFYAVVWVGLVRGGYAVLTGLVGLLLFCVGFWILGISYKALSVLFGLDMLAGSVVASFAWAHRLILKKSRRGFDTH